MFGQSIGGPIVNGKRSNVSFPTIQHKSREPLFHCIQCGKHCCDAPYSFGGRFACESCIRTYYQMTYPDISDAGIAEELRSRGYEAARLLKKHIKSRGKG